MNPPVTDSSAARLRHDSAARPGTTPPRLRRIRRPGCGQAADGWVAFVGAGPGDEGLLTVRATELLARADLVVAGPELADRLGQLATDGAETADTDALAQDPKLLVKAARAGQHVVRLLSGDPFLFGQAAAEAAACAKAKVPFEVVPGVPTATAVPAYAGIPLTSDSSGDVRIIHVSEVSRVQAGPGSLVILGAETGPADIAKMLVGRPAGRTPRRSPSPGTAPPPTSAPWSAPWVGHRRPQGRRGQPAHRPRARRRGGW